MDALCLKVLNVLKVRLDGALAQHGPVKDVFIYGRGLG